MKQLFKALSFLAIAQLPGSFRARVMRRVFGYDIHPTAHIGLCLVSAKYVRMGENAWIGTLTVAKGLNELVLEEYAQIGRLNWISGLPLDNVGFFSTMTERDPSLEMKRHSTITHRHTVDCSDKVTIGEFAGLGGFRTLLLTHSIDLKESRQIAHPIVIMDRSFVATNCVMLGGAVLPAYSALAAGSVLRGAPKEPGLYSGVPAKKVSNLDPTMKFFVRPHGRID